MATKKPSDNSLHHETDYLLGNERRIHTRPHQEAFRHPLGMTVNKETQVEIRDEDMDLLRETERRGFIQIRFKKR